MVLQLASHVLAVLVIWVTAAPALAGTSSTTSALPPLPGLAPPEAPAPVIPAGWRTLQFRDITFAVPPDWAEQELDSDAINVGALNKETRQGVAFGIGLERKPDQILDQAKKDGMQVQELGGTSVGGLPASRYALTGEIEKTRMSFWLTRTLMPNADNEYLVIMATVVGLDPAPYQGTLELVQSSVRIGAATRQEVAGEKTETVLGGLVTVTVPGSWTRRGEPDDPAASWQPPGTRSSYELRLDIGSGRNGADRLLSEFTELPRVTPGQLAGRAVTLLEGASEGYGYEGNSYQMAYPRRTLYLLDDCLPGGERLAVAVSGLESYLAQHRQALDKALASVKLDLPAGTASCAELVAHRWQGIDFSLPRVWLDISHPAVVEEVTSWKTLDPRSGKDIELSITHNRTLPPEKRQWPNLRVVGTAELAGMPVTVSERVGDSESSPTFTRTYTFAQPLRAGPGAGEGLRYLDIEFQVSATDGTALQNQPIEQILGSIRVDAALFGGQEGTSPGPSITASVTGDTDEPTVTCDGVGPCVEAGTGLPLRVLPRPFAKLYREPRNHAALATTRSLPAFHPLYVFAREGLDLSDPAAPKGWYRIGTGKKAAEGWIQAADVMEWRQALLVSYTHPGTDEEGRRPVLMFRDQEALRRVAQDPDRAELGAELYHRLEGGEVPAELISMEPRRFVDITKRFYLLPILRYHTLNIDGDDARLLQLGAAVPGRRGADTLAQPDYAGNALANRMDSKDIGQDLRVNVVFVMDTTRSTQPYIDATKRALAEMVRDITRPGMGERVRFGLIGYRDATAKMPALEYTVRNFTPTLVEAPSLLQILEQQVKASRVGSRDHVEEGFAGIDAALGTSWEPGALRFVELVGDASSHPKGHAQNTTGKDEADLRREADDAQVHIYALLLKDSAARDDHHVARAQLETLTRIRGSQAPALFEVDATQPADLQQAVAAVTKRMLERLSAPAQAGDAPAAADATADGVFDQLWESALIEYLGREAEPPKDVTAWALDRDLLQPTDRSLEVRVLVTRDQLSDLTRALDSVIQAFMRAELSQVQFFDALQAVSGQTMKRPEDVSQAMTLARSGLLPAFVLSLPYRSDILSMTDELFASMTAEQRSELQWNVLAKLEQYRTINEKVDAWQRLNESDPDSERVFALHVDYLP